MHVNHRRRIIGLDDLRQRYLEVYEDVRMMEVVYSRHPPQEDDYGLLLIHPGEGDDVDPFDGLTSER